MPMLTQVKNLARRNLGRALNRFGYSLVRTSTSNANWGEVLRTVGARPGKLTGLDIGANVGGISQMWLRELPRMDVYAFEPIPELFSQLRGLEAGHPNFKGFNLALGEAPGKLEFSVHAHKDASSFLPVTESYQSLYPTQSSVERKLSVEITTLDAWARGSGIPGASPIDLMKIDVQGYEGRVLKGGAETLKRTRHLVVETSLYPVYAGGELIDELCVQLREAGFRLVWAFDVYSVSADLFWENVRLAHA